MIPKFHAVEVRLPPSAWLWSQARERECRLLAGITGEPPEE
jgi:hypothetical protein